MHGRRFLSVALVLLTALPASAGFWRHRPIEVADMIIYTFDPPEPGLDEAGGWFHSLINGGLAIDGSQGFVSSPNALVLTYDSNPFKWGHAGAGKNVAVVPGFKYLLSTFIKADATVELISIRVNVYDAIMYGNLLASFSLAKSEIAAGWQLWSPGSFVPVSSTVVIDVVTEGEATSTVAQWALDDFTMQEVDMKKWGAISAAVDVLKGINGSTDSFHTNLESRAYTRLFTPTEMPDVKRPYACLPLDQEGERVEYEGYSFTSTWRLIGHAFFEDNFESDALDCAGAIAAANFRDDLVRAFMADQSLGGTTHNCELTSIETSSGIVDDGISEVTFTLEFTQIGGAADLAAA